MNTVIDKKDVFIDENLLMLWQKYILVPANINNDFFESGGDSMAAINLIVEVQNNYHVNISLEKFMRNPTISFLDKIIKDNNKE